LLGPPLRRCHHRAKTQENGDSFGRKADASRNPSTKLAAAMGVDMADWWVPAGPNYLGSDSQGSRSSARSDGH